MRRRPRPNYSRCAAYCQAGRLYGHQLHGGKFALHLARPSCAIWDAATGGQTVALRGDYCQDGSSAYSPTFKVRC
jgi:hypothetical protein